MKKLGSWEFFPNTHIKELTPDEVKWMYHLVEPAAVKNYYVAGYRLKLNHVCRELYEIFGPDNPIDELLRLSIVEMNKTQFLKGYT